MDNSFTLNASLVTAIAAILAPTITALIHSVKEYGIAKMSFTMETRIKYCKLFTSTYRKCQYGPEKTGYMTEFYESAMNLISICNKKATRRKLFKIANQVISLGASKETDSLYNECIHLLAKEF